MAELKRMLSLGLDYGTESVRALVVDTQTGEEAAQAVVTYPHGVITRALPDSPVKRAGTALPPDFALQHPGDYLDAGFRAIRMVLEKVSPSQIVGVGVDFTACTMLPTLEDGTPLMMLEGFRDNPHAWVKLWKHHGATEEADTVSRVARERGEPFLPYTSGQVSSEWMLPKCWETARKAPQIFEATHTFWEAGDWLVFQMTGSRTRNACAAGYKGSWTAEHGFPSPEFLTALDPQLANLPSKWVTRVVAPGRQAGTLSQAFASKCGLLEGTPVSAATIDAHSGVAGMGVNREGALSLILGTSTCHMLLSRKLALFDGYAGVAKDGILPGFYGYESGQAAVGDAFSWFAKSLVHESFAGLSERAQALKPGESGLMALDWHNGNRSVLMNPKLSGLIVGLTLHSQSHEIYRALIEATAYGTRRIVESYREGGIPIHELVACGGLTQDAFLLQTYADVTGLPLRVAASGQAVALGAAIFGALAAGRVAGGHDDLEDAVTRMTKPAAAVFTPRVEAQQTYDRLYALYLQLHDHFGVAAGRNVMTNLKTIAAQAACSNAAQAACSNTAQAASS